MQIIKILISTPSFRTATVQATDPNLVQILTKMQHPMQRPQCQQTSADKHVILLNTPELEHK